MGLEQPAGQLESVRAHRGVVRGADGVGVGDRERRQRAVEGVAGGGAGTVVRARVVLPPVAALERRVELAGAPRAAGRTRVVAGVVLVAAGGAVLGESGRVVAVLARAAVRLEVQRARDEDLAHALVLVHRPPVVRAARQVGRDLRRPPHHLRRQHLRLHRLVEVRHGHRIHADAVQVFLDARGQVERQTGPRADAGDFGERFGAGERRLAEPVVVRGVDFAGRPRIGERKTRRLLGGRRAGALAVENAPRQDVRRRRRRHRI